MKRWRCPKCRRVPSEGELKRGQCDECYAAFDGHEREVERELARHRVGHAKDSVQKAREELGKHCAQAPREGDDSPEMEWFRETRSYLRDLLSGALLELEKARDLLRDPRDRRTAEISRREDAYRVRRDRWKVRNESVTAEHKAFDSDSDREDWRRNRIKGWRRQRRAAALRESGWDGRCPQCKEQKAASQMVTLSVAELAVLGSALPLARRMAREAAEAGRSSSSACRSCHRRYLS